MKKIFAVLLAFALAFYGLPMTAHAAETYGYEVIISPSPVAIGSEVTLTIRLTDYTEEKSPLLGFQIDITDVDDVLHNAVCTSLATDKENLLSDVAKYQPSRDIVRHLYAKMNGTMAYSVSDLLEVKFTIPETYTEAGTLSLPLRILIENEAGDELTYRDTIEIAYSPDGEVPEPPAEEPVSVDVTWGAMNFTYTKGTWNKETHTYENAGWTDNGTGYVTVQNAGKVDTSVSFVYSTERADISGAFDVANTAALAAGAEITANLLLSGIPAEDLNQTVIGTVTVKIGGE